MLTKSFNIIKIFKFYANIQILFSALLIIHQVVQTRILKTIIMCTLEKKNKKNKVIK